MGTHRDTGERVEGLDDVRQSVEEILRTPIRTRPMDPDFGADLLAHVDRPMNAEGRARLYAGMVGAIARHDPRVTVDRARFTANALGEVGIELEASVGGAGIVAGSVPPSVDDARRIISPWSYHEHETYDPSSAEWPSRRGPRLVRYSNEDPAPGKTAYGVRFDPLTAVLGPSFTDIPQGTYPPLSLRDAWTIGISYRIDDPSTDQTVWEWGVLSGAVVVAGARHGWVSGSSRIDLSYVDTAPSNVALTLDGASRVTTWLWHIPESESRRAAIGYEDDAGVGLVTMNPIATHLDPETPFVVVVGADYSTGDPVDSMEGSIGRIGIWPRVLTSRERLAMRALWNRELGT